MRAIIERVGSERPSAAQSDSELERFFDLALDLLVIAGFDDYYKKVNRALERTLGYPRAELLSRPWFEFVHPDDVQHSRDAVRGVTQGIDVVGYENRFICADGTVRWLQWNTRIDAEQGVAYCVGRDVTERRLADAELRAAHRWVEASRDELAASRARIVAATDEARRCIARDLHDGAQQRLVHTVLTLRLARGAAQRGGDDVPALLSEALDNAEQAMAELRELAHGILPAVLARGGLGAGVAALTSRMTIPVEVDVLPSRLPAAVEATAYFVVAEALTNVTKHAGARRAAVTARVEGDTLAVRVHDDGRGGARPDGSGLLGLADRLAAVGGHFRVEDPADGGTLIVATIPVGGRWDVGAGQAVDHGTFAS